MTTGVPTRTVNVSPEIASRYVHEFPLSRGNRLAPNAVVDTRNQTHLTNSGGSVRISACNAGDSVEVNVTDTGRGIPKDYFPHVFDRFWHARETTYNGTGLGLAIAKGLVEAQGGTIRVQSEEGTG